MFLPFRVRSSCGPSALLSFFSAAAAVFSLCSFGSSSAVEARLKASPEKQVRGRRKNCCLTSRLEKGRRQRSPEQPNANAARYRWWRRILHSSRQHKPAPKLLFSVRCGHTTFFEHATQHHTQGNNITTKATALLPRMGPPSLGALTLSGEEPSLPFLLVTQNMLHPPATTDDFESGIRGGQGITV